MTEKEIELIKMIRECKYPEKALLLAVQTILLILEQH